MRSHNEYKIRVCGRIAGNVQFFLGHDARANAARSFD
jgi:hypothetical protein